MRILWVGTAAPLSAGAEQRAYRMLSTLSPHHQVDICCLEYAGLPRGEAHDRGMAAVRAMCSSITIVRHRKLPALFRCAMAFPTNRPLRVSYFGSPELQEVVRRRLAEKTYDLIWINRGRGFQFVPPNVRIPVIVDLHDSISLRHQKYLEMRRSPLHHAIDRIETVRLLRYERVIAAGASATLVSTEDDRRHIEGAGPRLPIHVIPNLVDVNEIASRPRSEELSLVFVGVMAYPPNHDAVMFFVREIFPSVLARCPDAHLHLVGARPPADIRELAKNPAITVTGFVADPHEYVAKAKAVVVPLRFGAGMSCKTLEAMAQGKPLVSTACGARGIDAVDGEHLLRADAPEAFADRTAQLLIDPDLRRRIGAAAEALVLRQYNQTVLARYIDEVLAAAATREPQRVAGVGTPG
jgi:polysaccharide biosynthesis protein PslH